MSDTLDRVRMLVARGDYLISSHGYDELEEDAIVAEDLLTSLGAAEVVEDYPDAVRGPSILLLHRPGNGEVIHAVWGLPGRARTPAVLVTAYRPNPARWMPDLLTRRLR